MKTFIDTYGMQFEQFKLKPIHHCHEDKPYTPFDIAQAAGNIQLLWSPVNVAG